MKATKSRHRCGEQRARRGAGRQDVIEVLSRRYRMWAVLPKSVDALLALGPPGTTARKQLVAVVPRPPFPPGVCTSCGCTEDDPCVTARGACAWWADEDRTLCTACDMPDELMRAVKAAGRSDGRRDPPTHRCQDQRVKPWSRAGCAVCGDGSEENRAARIRRRGKLRGR